MKKLLLDFLGFEKMFMPLVIKGLMYLGFFGVLIFAIVSLVKGEFLTGLLALVLGPIVVRLYSELLVVIFKINDNLQKLADKTTQEK